MLVAVYEVEGKGDSMGVAGDDLAALRHWSDDDGAGRGHGVDDC